MGRSPCCDKIGIKKGPWTPEEDIVLVSYIEKHGPRNWRTVPANTGLMRCSKSCRLRWTNYLRPGIKRGNFTTHEEGMIIHLQALLGNRWAAIASYLPQRTDNDIKNYWNTHLKKGIKKHQAVDSSHMSSSNSSTTCHEPLSRCYNSETRNADTSSGVHSSNPSSNLISSSYAASAENISKLLEAWIKSSPKADLTPDQGEQHLTINTFANNSSDFPSSLCLEGKQIRIDQDSCDPIAHEALKSYISYENTSGMAWEKSSLDVKCYGSSQSTLDDTEGLAKRRLDTQEPSFTSLEKWLLDEDTGRVDLMDLSPDCCSDEML